MKAHDSVELLNNPKVVAVAVAAGGTGIGTALSIIPPILGIVASLMSIILLGVLIRKGLLESSVKKLDIKERRMKIKAKEDVIKCRQEDGLPCRRHDDTDKD